MDGNTSWDTIPSSQCKRQQYDALYDGPAIQMSHLKEHTVIHTATADATFAITETGTWALCGYTLIHTEHSKLLFLNTASGKFKTKTGTTTKNLDLFTYINAKFIYVEKYVKAQLIQLHKEIVAQKCLLEKQVIRSMLSLIHSAPDDVAATLAKEPGSIALRAGEVIHLIRCIPATVTPRKTESCCQELPVTYRYQSFFLTPKNRILTPTGTYRNCNDLLPAMYELHGTWYRMLPRPSESMPPATLDGITKSNLRHVDPSNLATGGMYTSDELEHIKKHIMFPGRRNSVINNLSQGAAGQNVPVAASN